MREDINGIPKLLLEIDQVTKKVPSNARVDDTKGWDHGIDAVRYALVDYINKTLSILDVL